MNTLLPGRQMIDKLYEQLTLAGRIYLCGNGGSAANANHIANDWISVDLPAQSLCANVATITAIANDRTYVEVFALQLKVLGRARDLLVVLSGSGSSPNVVAAVAMAKTLGMRVAVITGAWKPAPPITEVADLVFRIGDDMQEAEEAQLFIGHEIYRMRRSKQ